MKNKNQKKIARKKGRFQHPKRNKDQSARSRIGKAPARERRNLPSVGPRSKRRTTGSTDVVVKIHRETEDTKHLPPMETSSFRRACFVVRSIQEFYRLFRTFGNAWNYVFSASPPVAQTS